MPDSYVGTRVLVPLDGSQEVRSALGPAADIATASHGELVLLVVLNDYFKRTVGDRIHLEHMTAEYVARQLLLEVESGLCGELDDLVVRQEVRASDDPAAAIVDVASEVDATMIAMTSHGIDDDPEHHLGLVTSTVLANSVLPVLVAPIRNP